MACCKSKRRLSGSDTESLLPQKSVPCAALTRLTSLEARQNAARAARWSLRTADRLTGRFQTALRLSRCLTLLSFFAQEESRSRSFASIALAARWILPLFLFTGLKT